jgi:hypothetical protein
MTFFSKFVQTLLKCDKILLQTKKIHNDEFFQNIFIYEKKLFKSYIL